MICINETQIRNLGKSTESVRLEWEKETKIKIKTSIHTYMCVCVCIYIYIYIIYIYMCVYVWGRRFTVTWRCENGIFLVGKDGDDDYDDDDDDDNNNNNNLGSWVSVVIIHTGVTVRGSISCRDKIFLSYPKHPERLVRSTEPLTQWIQEVLLPGVKRPGRKADHSLPHLMTCAGATLVVPSVPSSSLCP